MDALKRVRKKGTAQPRVPDGALVNEKRSLTQATVNR